MFINFKLGHVATISSKKPFSCCKLSTLMSFSAGEVHRQDGGAGTSFQNVPEWRRKRQRRGTDCCDRRTTCSCRRVNFRTGCNNIECCKGHNKCWQRWKGWTLKQICYHAHLWIRPLLLHWDLHIVIQKTLVSRYLCDIILMQLIHLQLHLHYIIQVRLKPSHISASIFSLPTLDSTSSSLTIARLFRKVEVLL